MTILVSSIHAFPQDTNMFYSFVVKTITNEDFNFASLKGKKVLIVNTASKCGFTPQYEMLQELYDKYGGEKFVILGFPSNDFANQEPGSAEEIQQFCKINYGVTFPIMAKISVKGEEMHPLYHWLTNKSENGFEDSKVRWNFQKYLIDENGKLVKVLASNVNPLSEEIISWLEN